MTQQSELDFDKDLCLYTLKTGFDEVALTLQALPIVLIQIIIDYCAIFEPEDGGTPWPYFLDTTFNEEIMNVLNNTGTRMTCLHSDYDRIMLNILLLNKYQKIQSSAVEKKKSYWVCCIFSDVKYALASTVRFGLAMENFRWMQRETDTQTVNRLASDPKEVLAPKYDLVMLDGSKVNPADISDGTFDIIKEARKVIIFLPLSIKLSVNTYNETLQVVRLDKKQGVTTQYLVHDDKSKKPLDKSAKSQ